MRSTPSIVLGLAWLALTVVPDRAEALTTTSVDECLATQLRQVAKAAAGHATCHAKAAEHAEATDTQCLGKATLKLSSALGKLESKKTCQIEGAAVELAGDAFDYATELDATVGHAGKCDGKKIRATAKLVTAVTGCYAKAAGKTGAIDPECVTKAVAKHATAVGNAEKGVGCSAPNQSAVLRDAAASFVDEEACKLDAANPACDGTATPTPTATPPTPTPTVSATPICNDGINQPGEPCDPSAPSSGWGACSADATCVGCTCACPATMTFTADPTDPATTLDLGWTGTWHRTPLATDGTLTVALDCPASTHPCGTCAVSGPLPNPQAGAGQIDTRRCSTNPAKRCASDATCAARTCLGGSNDGGACSADSACPSGTCPAAGPCAFHAGAPFAAAAGGIPVCFVQRIAGSVVGTADVESGAAALATTVESDAYLAAAVDAPCPRCADDGPANDGTAGGTCDAGPRGGLACDANASVPSRPDFGRTSLDCPPPPPDRRGTVVTRLDTTTDVVTRTLSSASPSCTGLVGSKCLCETCNGPAAEPCFSNADCPPSGGSPGVCGGKRCLGGANAGAPCGADSECPGALCNRPGIPPRPFSCSETCEPLFDPECTDVDDDGEGECMYGPTDQLCSLASGHGQRGCTNDAHCGGASGSCETVARKCFLTGGSSTPGSFHVGTGTLTAAGAADAPVSAVSHPTLASVFCANPTSSPSINVAIGLPGPGRATVSGTLRLQP